MCDCKDFASDLLIQASVKHPVAGFERFFDNGQGKGDLHDNERKLSGTRAQLKLPDSLVREAQASGLLTAQALEALLREEVQRRRVGQLFDAADRLATLPPLTETEVEAEIQAARAERRSSRASGR
jgi:hypothetical protein